MLLNHCRHTTQLRTHRHRPSLQAQAGTDVVFINALETLIFPAWLYALTAPPHPHPHPHRPFHKYAGGCGCRIHRRPGERRGDGGTGQSPGSSQGAGSRLTSAIIDAMPGRRPAPVLLQPCAGSRSQAQLAAQRRRSSGRTIVLPPLPVQMAPMLEGGGKAPISTSTKSVC